MKIQLKKGDKGFKELRWLSKALSRDKCQTAAKITMIYKKGDTFCATNGARLHLWDDPNGRFQSKPDGFYAIATNTAQKLVIYWDQDEEKTVWPAGISHFTAIRHSFPDKSEYINDGTRSTSCVFAQIVRDMESPEFIEYKFLKDALSFGGPFHVIQEAPEKPVCIKSGDLFALIMPVMV